jgi:hypothetical protein
VSGTAFTIGSTATFSATINNYVSTAALTSSTFVTDYGTSVSAASEYIGTLTGSVITATSNTSITLASATALTATSQGYVSGSSSVAKLDSSRFVTVHASNGCLTTLTAEIGQYLGTSVSYSTAQNLPNSICVGSQYNYAVTALDSTHFVVGAYNSNGAVITAVACTAIGTTISCGAFTNLGAAGASSTGVAVTTMDSTHFVLSYYDTTGTAVKTAAASVSGTTITWGAVVSTGGGANATFSRLTTMDSTHFVLAYATNSSSSVIAGSLSGTTITLGSAVQVNASNTSLIDVEGLTSSTFAVAYSASNNSQTIYALTGSVASSTVITLNSQQLVSPTSPTTGDGMSLIGLSSTSLVLTYGYGGTNTIAHLPLTVSGTSFTVGSTATFTVNTNNYVTTMPLTSTTFLVDYGTSVNAASEYIGTVGFGGASSSIAATTAAGQAATVTNAGEAIFRSSGVSNFAFQIQDASGNALFTLDTVNNLIVAQDSSGINVLTIDLTNHRVGIGTTSPGTALSVNGGNNINPSYPDGLVGTAIFTTSTASTGNCYVVPSGKTLYITHYGSTSGTAGLALSTSSCTPGVSGLVGPSATSVGVSLNTPIIAGSGTMVTASANGFVMNISGFLVNSGVTPIFSSVTASGTSCYTVPSGKTLYITSFGSNGTTVGLSLSTTNCTPGTGGIVTPTVANGNGISLGSPLIVPAGTMVSVSVNGWSASFSGYLANSNGLGGN